MSKLLANRRHLNADTTAYAQSRAVNSSMYKMNLVADMIRRQPVAKALLQLQFSNKKAARVLHDLLKSAIANAEHNKMLDIDQLYVSEILLGKSYTLKRHHARARGRAGRIFKEYVVVKLFVSL